MRKFTCLILALCLALALALPASADGYSEEERSYRDPLSGMRITAPVGWHPEKDADEEDVLFVRDDGSFTFIGVDVSDDIGSVDDEKRLMDTDKLSPEEFAETYFLDTVSCDEVTVDGRKFFAAVTYEGFDVGEETITVPVLYIVRAEKGIVYNFFSIGMTGDPAYDDMLELLSCTTFPNLKGKNAPGGVGGLLAAAGIAIIFFLLRLSRKLRKTMDVTEPEESGEAVEAPEIAGAFEPETAPEVPEAPEYIRCPSCGAAMRKTVGKFCPYCGKKL